MAAAAPKRQMDRGWMVAVWLTAAATAAWAADFQELAAKATVERQADHVPQAIDLYQQALQIKADWAEGWFYLGTLEYDADRYAEAQQAFGRFVTLQDTPAGWAFLGLCESETGAFREAQVHLRKALDGRLPPEIDPVARLHEALMLTRLGDFEQAERWYAPLVRAGSQDPTLISGLGLNSLERMRLPRELRPEESALASAAGQAAYAWFSGNPGAAALFQSLVKSYPDAPGVHRFYGAFLLETQPEQAISQLRQEVERNPGSGGGRALLALALVKTGRGAEALPYARKAAEEQPESALSQYAYGEALADPHDAVSHLEIAAGRDSSNLEYHMALARVYSKIGRYDEARRERKLSIQLARQSSLP